MKRKKMIIGTSCIFVLLIIVLLGASQYMLNYSLRPKNRGKNLESSWQYMFKTYSYLKPWIDSLKQNQALKDTFIYSPDHVKLHAYYVASSRPTAKTAIIVHGYTDNAIRMMMIGYLYNKKLDFNILLPDLRQLSDVRVFEYVDFITLDDGETPLRQLLVGQSLKLSSSFRSEPSVSVNSSSQYLIQPSTTSPS